MRVRRHAIQVRRATQQRGEGSVHCGVAQGQARRRPSSQDHHVADVLVPKRQERPTRHRRPHVPRRVIRLLERHLRGAREGRAGRRRGVRRRCHVSTGLFSPTRLGARRASPTAKTRDCPSAKRRVGQNLPTVRPRERPTLRRFDFLSDVQHTASYSPRRSRPPPSTRARARAVARGSARRRAHHRRPRADANRHPTGFQPSQRTPLSDPWGIRA